MSSSAPAAGPLSGRAPRRRCPRPPAGAGPAAARSQVPTTNPGPATPHSGGQRAHWRARGGSQLPGAPPPRKTAPKANGPGERGFRPGGPHHSVSWPGGGAGQRGAFPRPCGLLGPVRPWCREEQVSPDKEPGLGGATPSPRGSLSSPGRQASGPSARPAATTPVNSAWPKRHRAFITNLAKHVSPLCTLIIC